MNSRIVCLASLCALCAAAEALSQPMLAIVPSGPGSVTVQIIADANGSIASEIAAVDGGFLGTGDILFTGAFIADTMTFDTPNPGANPITGTITDGLYLDALATNEIFASFGTGIIAPGTYDFLTITYVGQGQIDAFGLIASQGEAVSVFDSIIVPEPASASFAMLLAASLLAPCRRGRRSTVVSSSKTRCGG